MFVYFQIRRIFTCMINQQMHIREYIQSDIITILHQHVSVTPLSYNMSTIHIQINVQKCMIRPLHVYIYDTFTYAYLLVYHISAKYSLVHRYGTHKRIN